MSSLGGNVGKSLMNIRSKIIIGSILGSVLTVVGVGYLVGTTAINDATQSLEVASKNSLISLRNSKKEQVESYFKTITGQLSTYSNNQMTIDAMRGLGDAFDEMKSEIAKAETTETPTSYQALQDYYTGPFSDKFKALNNGLDPQIENVFDPLDSRTLKLQDLYIAKNVHPLGKKDAQITADDGSKYSKLHEQYHPFIRSYLQQFGYYDIFLVNNEGDVVYSVFKELDYATNLLSGPYANSGLGKAFRASQADNVAPNSVKVIDFDSYYPSYNGAASFFSSPIYAGEEKLGVLIMQAPVDELNKLMTSNNSWKKVGLGDSGETYIVGGDNLLRNDSRFLIEDKANYAAALKSAGDPNVDTIVARGTSIGLQNANTKGTKDALSGNEGFDIFPDYRGINVLSAYTPLNIPGLNWVLMSEIDEEEAFRAVEGIKKSIFKNTLLIGLAALLLFGLGAFLLIRSITKPLSKLTKTINSVADGDLTARAKMDSADELETLGNAFDGMLDERLASLEAEAKSNKELNQSVIALMNATSELADRDLTIEVPVAEDVTGSVSDALNMMIEETSDVLIEINNVSKQVDDSVKLVKSQAIEAKSAADNEKVIIKSTIGQLIKVSDSIKNIGGLVETVSSLAKKVHASSTTTAATVDRNIEGMSQIKNSVSEAETKMKQLGENSTEIGSIVEIINTLSERTNLLAVSASMQAASAGEAGLEFGVIADEIKRISESSKKSTLEISELVKNIQENTLQAISTMDSSIEKVNEGTKLAAKSGAEMRQTKLNATELAELIDRISIESKSQNQANIQMMSQVNNVLESTEKTSSALDKQRIQTTNLVIYAEKLRSEVGSFKLPDQ